MFGFLSCCLGCLQAAQALCRGRAGVWAWLHCGAEPRDLREDGGGLEESLWSTGQLKVPVFCLSLKSGTPGAMGPLSAAGSWGGSSSLKVAIRSQSWEAYDDPPPTCWCGAAVPGEDQRLPGEGGQQLLVVGTGPGLGQPGRGFAWRA